MTLPNKVEMTRSLARDRGIDLQNAPLLAVFDMPVWGGTPAFLALRELAKTPAAQMAILTPDPLPETMAALALAPRVHAIAERGLVCGRSGGAVLHVYPTQEAEMVSFAVALFAGVAPLHMRIALGGHLSSGRQEVALEGAASSPPCTARELLSAVRLRNGVADMTDEESVVVDDLPANLGAVRAAIAGDLPGRPFRVARLPSGRFRLTPDRAARPISAEEMLATAQGIAVSCDRFLGACGEGVFGFSTEAVARGQYTPERGARALAQDLFGAPETAITVLGMQPFTGEGTLFFAYEGSESVWEAANRGIACVPVHDMAEYVRILATIRRGE